MTDPEDDALCIDVHDEVCIDLYCQEVNMGYFSLPRRNLPPAATLPTTSHLGEESFPDRCSSESSPSETPPIVHLPTTSHRGEELVSNRRGLNSYRNGTEGSRLARIFDFAGLTEKERKTVVSKCGITSFESLRDKVHDLKLGKHGQGAINGMRRLTLWKVVLWYEEYLRVNNKRDPDWKVELTQEALVDFELHGFSIPCAKREGLNHVLRVLLSRAIENDALGQAMANGVQNSLADRAGICSFDDVIKNRDELQKGSGVTCDEGRRQFEAIPPKIQKELAQVAHWFCDFVKKRGRAPDLISEFTSEVFRLFIEKNSCEYSIDPESCYNLIKNNIHEKCPSALLKGLLRDDRRMYAATVDAIMELAKQDVLSNVTLKLAEATVEGMEGLIKFWLKKLINFKSTDPGRRPMVFNGDMQSGKTALTAIGLVVCATLKIPSVVITKGRKEALELLGKLKIFAPKALKKYIVGLAGRKNSEQAMSVLQNGGTFVLFDSKSQLNKAVTILEENWKGKQFAAQIDEGRSLRRAHQAITIVTLSEANMSPHTELV